MSNPINLRPSGPPETVLDPEPEDARLALAAALALADAEQRDAVSQVVRDHPRMLAAWAALGDRGRDEVEAYAAYRVGYHRGLDRLRANGWRGSGFVRSAHPENLGFLSALAGLARTAGAIGERDEADRCGLFLAQLDPGGMTP